VAAPFHFEHSVAFSPDVATDTLRAIPALPGVFALHGPATSEGAPAQPYLTRAADLRRRITRILAPPTPSADGRPAQSKRLNLRSRVARIDYTITGSEFESHLCLYHAAAAVFGLDEARRRLKLRTPFFLRFTAENAYPRVYSTNRLSKRALANFYGPFPSRAAADRYCDAVLDLFKLRRCYENLAPYPEHPGCVYQEMKKCLAPCNQACTPEGAAAYSAEAEAVKAFFDTRGESMLATLSAEREAASNDLDFERAARVHDQWQKVKAAASLADELVQPIPKLRAIIVQKAASAPPNVSSVILSEDATAEVASQSKDLRFDEPTAAIFLLQSGCIVGPERLSTLGVRAVKEQTSVGSSLFAQPLMLQAIPLDDPSAEHVLTTPADNDETCSIESVILSEARSAESKDLRLPLSGPAAPTLNPEARAAAVIATLEERASAPTDIATLSDHLSLLRRWYYRPEKQRTGEVFFPREDGSWPIRRILRGAARMALGEPTAMVETHRDQAIRNPADEAQKPTRTKTLHAGRPDVERVVPTAPKRFRSRKSGSPETKPASETP
jgi:hypothetical protein